MFKHILIALVILQTAALPSAASDTVYQGKVKWWDNNKGFGYIESDNGDPDIYVNASQIDFAGDAHLCLSGCMLPEGMCIQYQIYTDSTGRERAYKLQLC